ncbi:prenyltransferase/squalene oxidase repeat-containing protein [Kibdelosporangium persicum]|uniref:Squalene-hopene cyclase C-terminal domain-containing protein n=1 Tax=Kibdelosporangium persicum TaxID=2698649 RepID=A0ABX2F5N5_9PSEU|nr:prenyltransferase/squalene oxidase repeat-containing protein [Kibdelosporangium persicum]NRN66133.1 Squalene-hopene cyclase C-terminal domain-containing protein [Kibdelosporangium persicum]
MNERKVLLVNLIISVGSGERFLVWLPLGGPCCPQVKVLAGAEPFGRRIEAAAMAALGVAVAYREVLSYQVFLDGTEVYALVKAHEPVEVPPGLVQLPLAQLTGMRTDPLLLTLFQVAGHRAAAEQFAVHVGGEVQRALAKSAEYLEEKFTAEGGRCGWSQYLSNDAVGVLSSAQGLLALAHTKIGSRYIAPTAACLKQSQNEDGGWQVRHSLIGQPNDISITESTCYCMWALLEAGRTPDELAVARGAGWLLATQRGSGGWGASELTKETQVIATAFAVRVLARLGCYPKAVERGVDWLLSAQCPDGGWDYVRVLRKGKPSAAPTAHAVISLLAAGIRPDEPAVARACVSLREKFSETEAEPWRSTIFDTLVDPNTGSRLTFRNYATPWALIALYRAGSGFVDRYIQKGVTRLLDQQDDDGSWRCNGTIPSRTTMWAAHDAVYALTRVVGPTVVDRPVSMECHNEACLEMEAQL